MKNLNLQAVPGIVLVQRDESKKHTKGGLHLPETYQALECAGVVLTSGVDGIHKGERILFSQGNRVSIHDFEFVVIKEENLVAKILEDDEEGS